MQKAKKQPRTVGAVGAEVISYGEINVDKTIEQTPMTQARRSCIPKTLPKLVMSTGGTFLVYGGFRNNISVPASSEQVRRHLACLQQHLQEVAYVS